MDVWDLCPSSQQQGSLGLVVLDMSLGGGLSQQGWQGAGHKSKVVSSLFYFPDVPRDLLSSPLTQITRGLSTPGWSLLLPPSRKDSQFHSP